MGTGIKKREKVESGRIKEREHGSG